MGSLRHSREEENRGSCRHEYTDVKRPVCSCVCWGLVLVLQGLGHSGAFESRWEPNPDVSKPWAPAKSGQGGRKKKDLELDWSGYEHRFCL